MQGKIGILGFGVVGKSVLKFLKENNSDLAIDVWDQRELNSDEKKLIEFYRSNYFNSDLKEFFELHDHLLVSPGINLNKFNLSKDDYNKCICELDLFADNFKKQSVAVTGTLGKTTITTLLTKLINQIKNNNKIPFVLSLSKDLNGFIKGIPILRQAQDERIVYRFINALKLAQKFKFSNLTQVKAAMGGNVGIGMLDLIENQQDLDLAVLELSSFQLYFNKKFAPKIAIWNNFFANHLDWHSDLNDYFQAKCKIFENQNKDQYLLINADFLNQDIKDKLIEKLKRVRSQICFIGGDVELVQQELKDFNKDYFCCFSKGNNLRLAKINLKKITEEKKIFNLNYLPNFSFEQNWFFVLAALYFLGSDLKKLEKIKFDFSDLKEQQEHRLELFTTINGIDFYNDSKSTVIQATQAALQKLDKKNKPIILVLGGQNKGVDRTPLVQFLSKLKNLKKVFCLGQNYKEFNSFESYSSLEHLLHAILQIAKPGDSVLFSPSGSSFDFFENYKQRGKAFKQLVLNLERK